MVAKMKEIGENTETSFIKVMGSSPVNKLIDFLIENDRESWSMNEISENARIGYSTLKLLLPELEKTEIIKVTKKVGKIKLYTMNKENPIVKELYDLHKMISITEMQKHLKKAKQKVKLIGY